MASPGTDTLLALYERMVLIRRMEERLSEVAKSGEAQSAKQLLSKLYSEAQNIA